MTWSLPELLRATGARLLQWGPGPFRGVSTDTRTLAAGDVFVALTGPNHDGHEFAGAAVEAGATAALVSRDRPPPDDAVAWLRVTDGLEALGDLAAARRQRLPAMIVGVTGSNGKTTTKEMIAAVLAASGAKVARSAGNENNLVGVPRTLLRLEGDEDFVVVEMGMNHAGEIWRLAEIARPDVGVITNVGPAHLEGLGSLENVAAAKGELALAMSSRATLVVNASDPRVARIGEQFHGRALHAANGGPVRSIGARAAGDGTQRMTLEIAGKTIEVRLRAVGAHNVTNALLAATVGVSFGLSPETIAAGLERFAPPPMRLEIVRLPGGALVWNDAYNANPASVEAALAALAAEPASRRVAVLGEMWELGDEAPRWHRRIGRLAAEWKVDWVVAVGRLAEETVAGARETGLPPSRTDVCATPEAAVERLAGELRRGDLVLIKGSRAARLETIARALGEKG